MRLGSKISLAFLPGTLLAVVVIGGALFPSLESRLKRPIGDQHVLMVRQMMGTIDRVLYERLNEIQVIAASDAFSGYLSDGRSRERAVANKVNHFVELTGPWNLLTLVAPDGRIRYASDKRLIGTSLDVAGEDARALKRALGGAASYSNLVHSAWNGKPTVLFAAPVIDPEDPDRAILGAVVGQFSWRVVVELLEDSEDELVYRLYDRDASLIAAGGDRRESGGAPRVEDIREVLRPALAGRTGTSIRRSADGREELVAYAPQLGHLSYRGSGWILTAETPLAAAFFGIKGFLLDFVLGLVALLALSFVAAIWIIRRSVSKPLVEFASAVRGKAKGDLPGRIEVAAEDEIGELARSFNQMVADLRDTTVSKAALHESEERVRLLLDSAAEAICGIDLAGNCTFANQACLRLLGCKSSVDIVGRNVHALVHPVHPDGAPCRFERELAECGTGHSEDEVFQRAGGGGFPVEYWSHPVHRAGALVGAVVSFMDITERKRLKAMLVQSEKLSAVGQLAAGVAHEINNPLCIILGFAQSAAKRVGPSDVLGLPIKSIEREAVRCKHLVENLLSFSRQSDPRMEAMDLNDTVTSTLCIIEAQARVRAVEVAKELGDAGPVLGDRNQLQQVIVNLCGNALDAMPEGGRLTVRTKRAAGGGAVLEVADTGFGIPEEIQGKIFDPFFTTKEVGKGTGLGLSLVYEIVRRHGGSIEVASRERFGTTFTIFLPAGR